MYRMATARVLTATVWVAMRAYAQIPSVPGAAGPAVTQGDWRKIGNTLIDRALAGLATGPVDRVWYSADGSQVFIRTSSGKVFATGDFETWQVASALPPSPVSRPGPGAATLPRNWSPRPQRPPGIQPASIPSRNLSINRIITAQVGTI